MAADEDAHDDGLDIVDGLVQLSFEVQAVLARVAADLDLSLAQVRLLGILRDRDAEMLQLAAHLGLDKSSVTGLVSRAERRELVRRVPSPRDGRAVLVTLTPRGRRLTRDGEQRIRGAIRALTAGLDQHEQDTLTALAARILRP
ncbi:MarR family winged helix-turn-helix transcriptional regulator [Actinomadura fibrosa]|uniref:MarR family winged helix-turn-helix transcriptional regulator n=1 Tax=Actinomadura fibrosa TaxID=111802 RepID=A0ABW2Y3I0_9ACTN|nr:MarR family transcriptional regulator [Actinomadura fibrosa]